MTNTPDNYFMTALCAYREARSQGSEGMAAVINVIRNRYIKHMTSPYVEVTKKWQFSSITDPDDKQLAIWPSSLDDGWRLAQTLAEKILNGQAPDNTNGATVYYNPYAIQTTQTTILDDGSIVPFPHDWNKSALHQTVVIGTKPQMHVFFREG